MSPKLWVRATLNGQPKRFLLDTGASRSMLASDEQTKTMPKQGKTKFGGMAWKPKKCDWVKADTFEVAGVNFTQAPLTRCEEAAKSVNALGVEYLDHMTAFLDFEHGGFSLHPPGMPEGSHTQKLRRGPDRLIGVPVKIADKSEWAIFDTGCSITTIDQDFVDKHSDAFRPVTGEAEGKTIQAKIRSYDVTGNAIEGKLYTTRSLQIGGHWLPEQLVMSSPLSKKLKDRMKSSIILGANSILFGSWILDLKNDVWAMNPIEQKAPKIRIEVNGDHISQQGKTIILQDNAKIAQAERMLSGDKITYDEPNGVVECTGHCIFSNGTESTSADAMSFKVSEEGWNRTDSK